MESRVQSVPLLEDVNGEPIYLGDIVYRIPNSANLRTGRTKDRCVVVGVGSRLVWIKPNYCDEIPKSIPANQLTHDNLQRIIIETNKSDYEYCCLYNLTINDDEDMHTVVKKHLVDRVKKMIYLDDTSIGYPSVDEEREEK